MNKVLSRTFFLLKRSDWYPMRACIYDIRGKVPKWLIDLEISLDKNIDNEGENPTWLIDLKFTLIRMSTMKGKNPSDWLI